MKITALSAQVKNPERINVFVDGKFCFGLDLAQVVDLGVKVGLEISAARLSELEKEGEFGKLYLQALNYCLLRPRSVRELRDYLWRKTLPSKYKTRQGNIKERAGVSADLTERVLAKLQSKNYVNDEKFAAWWVENRFRTKGVSARRLRQDLVSKGISHEVIERTLAESDRQDSDELAKIIAKKAKRYADSQKLIAYLVRQGFDYDDVKQAVAELGK